MRRPSVRDLLAPSSRAGCLVAVLAVLAVPAGAAAQTATIHRDAWGVPHVLADTDRPSLPVGGASGPLGSVFSYYSVPRGSAAPRLGVAGNSFVKVVEFGPTVRGRSVLNSGQSGDPGSPHFFDQASLYAGRSFKPAHFSREEVEANSVRSYVVGPEGRIRNQ